MDSQAQLRRNHQAEKPIRINHPEEEEHHEKGPLKVVKKVKEKAKKIKKALTKHGHGHGHEHDRGEHIPDDHDIDEEDEDDNDRVIRDVNPVGAVRSSGVSEKEERRRGATLTPQNTPVSLPSVPGEDDDQLGHERDMKMGNSEGFGSKTEEEVEQASFTDKVAGMVSPVYGKVKETGATVLTKLPFSQQVQDKGVSAREYLTEKLSPGEEDKVLSEVVAEKLHIGGVDEKKGIVTQSEEVEKRLGGFGDQRSEEERKHGEAFADQDQGGMVEKLRGAVTSWISGTTQEVTQKSTESSSQSLASTIGNMGPGGDQNTGSVPLQKRFQ